MRKSAMEIDIAHEERHDDWSGRILKRHTSEVAWDNNISGL